jgi:hypothetical protein
MKTMSFVLVGLLSATLTAAGKAPTKTSSKADYIAHEWGTFTSVQGRDGVQLEWNPFVVEELPQFVYDVNKSAGRKPGVVLPSFVSLAKIGILSRQRMETPVIYFYSDEARKVDVEVNFPEGRITEWYPQLAPLDASGKRPANFLRSSMKWGGIEILPGNGADEARFFPKDETGSHYYAARETDASGLRVQGANGATEYEKFLFYRGVGQFEAPLRVTHWGDHADNIRLENRGSEKLGRFFIYAVRGNKAAMVQAPALDAKVMHDVEFPFDKIARPVEEVRTDLANQLRNALVSEGLYPREAAAMVKTWDDSWFGEQGTRVLYTLSQTWSDKVLPLKITPAPKEIKRVFVGRAELITPAQEWALLKEVVRYAEGGSLERRAAITAVSGIGFGRFADAALRRLSMQGPGTKDFNQAVWSVLDATRPEPARPATTAASPR